MHFTTISLNIILSIKHGMTNECFEFKYSDMTLIPFFTEEHEKRQKLQFGLRQGHEHWKTCTLPRTFILEYMTM